MLERKTIVSTRRVEPSAFWRVCFNHSTQLLAAPDILTKTTAMDRVLFTPRYYALKSESHSSG